MNRNWSLVFDDDLFKAVADMKDNTSRGVSILYKASKVLQRENLHVKQTLLGSFSSLCKVEAIPPTRKSFLYIFRYDSSIDQPPPGYDKFKSTTSIGQQIVFNSVGRSFTLPDSVPHHLRESEAPTSLYMSTKLYPQSAVKQ